MRAAAEMAEVERVHFIEKIESFHTVAPRVREWIDRIDQWLTSLDPSLPEELLAWGTNVEGGLMNQRVQDFCLLVRSYVELFNLATPSAVHIICHPEWIWEDRVLELCARARGLRVVRHANRPWAVRFRATLSFVRPWAIAAYYLFNELRLMVGRKLRPIPANERGEYAIFQLCSSGHKHVENISHLMKALEAKGLRTAAVCWCASERWKRGNAVTQLTSSGLRAIYVERYLTIADTVTSCWKAASLAIRARKGLSPLKWADEERISLDGVFDESLRHYFIAELPRRLRYARGLARAMDQILPIMVKPWGGADFFEGRLLLRLTRSRAKPLFVHYWVGTSIDWPYGNRDRAPDLFLAKSGQEALVASKEYGLPSERVVTVGAARFGGYRTFRHQHAPADSRKLLGLPHDGAFYLGLDPNTVLRGYQSAREQTELLQVAINLAGSNPRIVVIVKPHPSYPVAKLRALLDEPRLSNVVVLPQHASVNHFLNAVDVLIAKYSTLILEAVLLHCPAIAAIMDGEPRFRIFGELAQAVWSKEELAHLLSQLTSDPDAFTDWKQGEIARATELLDRYYWEPVEGPANSGADAIMKRLHRPLRVKSGAPALC